MPVGLKFERKAFLQGEKELVSPTLLTVTLLLSLLLWRQRRLWLGW
jgi:hypothetical protein